MNLDADNITAAFTAIAAISGLFLGIVGLRRQSRSLDAENLIRLMDRSFEAEKQFSTIKIATEDEKEWIANEHFNFLEGLACLYNHKLINRFAREWCKDVLANNLAAIQMMIWLHKSFQKSVTKDDTYKELAIFLKRHKLEIESLVQAHDPKRRSP